MRRLVIATRNPGKAREIAEILSEPGVGVSGLGVPKHRGGLPYEIASLADYPDAPEPEETGATFQENSIIKATACAGFTGELSLADDSGLEVDALNGAPGIHSARFAPTTPERNAKLLDAMKDVPDGSRAARFRCVVAIAAPDGSVQTYNDLNNDHLLNNGFTPTPQNGFIDNTAELPPAEFYSRWSLRP